MGEVSLASRELCDRAIAAAKSAYPAWRSLDPRAKRDIFRRAENILARRAAEAGRIIALEKGSPYPESLAVEVFGALQSINYYGHNQGRLLRPKRAGHHTPLFLNKSGEFHFHPLGPTLIISPWNFPFLIPFSDTLSALTAGNTVVLRPSTSTPFTALLIGEVFLEAGLPPGVLNVVVCKTPLAEAMVVDRDIQTVMFTGSVGIGKRIMELCSRNLTNLTLELGGKDPMIVLEDADIERAARGAVWAAFMNCGQSCGSVERVYVARPVAEAFTARVLELAGEVRVGDPLDEGIGMGPMATAGQLQVVEEHIADARAKGAGVPLGGGRVPGRAGHFIQPTVLTGVDHTMLCMTEETFGPTLPIMAFDGDEQAVALANDSIYGLTASVWTQDRKRAAWFAERLEAGSVTINDHMYSFVEPRAIWGGIKQTGHGPVPRSLRTARARRHQVRRHGLLPQEVPDVVVSLRQEPSGRDGKGDRALPRRRPGRPPQGRPGTAEALAPDRGHGAALELRPGPAEDPEEMKTPPRLIGLTGTNGAGKGEAAAFFVARGYAYFSLSDVIRDELRERGEPENRDGLIRTGNALREGFGPDVLARRTMAKVGPGERAVIDSIRNTAEIAFLRRQDGFVLLAIDAPVAVRFARVAARGRDESAADLEAFRKKEDEERAGGAKEQQLEACMAAADRLVTNDGTIPEFHRKLEEVAP